MSGSGLVNCGVSRVSTRHIDSTMEIKVVSDTFIFKED